MIYSKLKEKKKQSKNNVNITDKIQRRVNMLIKNISNNVQCSLSKFNLNVTLLSCINVSVRMSSRITSAEMMKFSVTQSQTLNMSRPKIKKKLQSLLHKLS